MPATTPGSEQPRNYSYSLPTLPNSLLAGSQKRTCIYNRPYVPGPMFQPRGAALNSEHLTLNVNPKPIINPIRSLVKLGLSGRRSKLSAVEASVAAVPVASCSNLTSPPSSTFYPCIINHRATEPSKPSRKSLTLECLHPNQTTGQPDALHPTKPCISQYPVLNSESPTPQEPSQIPPASKQ